MKRHLTMKPWSLCCTLALLLAAPLLAAPPAPTPHPTMVLQVGHVGGISAFAYSPDGKTLATGGDDGARLWDAASGQVRTTLPAGSVLTLAIAPNGKTLATADGVGVRLWDIASGQLKSTLPDAYDTGSNIPLLAFAPDSVTLATGGLDDNGNPVVWLWDVTSRQLKATLKPSLSYVDTLTFPADSRTLVGHLSWASPLRRRCSSEAGRRRGNGCSV